MAKLFLHIGPHKTGSTFIQKYFCQSRERLRGLGVDYPDVDIVQYGHHRLVEEIKKLDQPALDKYVSRFMTGEVVFVSSENFDRLKSKEIEKLGEALSTVDVKIVYYYRNYADLLPSIWQEQVKNGATISFHEFALPHVLRPFNSEIINPARVLDNYADVFGIENITVIDYDHAKETNGILAPIADLLGITLEIENDSFVNKSLRLEDVEIIRALNVIASHHKTLKANNVRASYLQRRQDEPIRVDIECLLNEIQICMRPVQLTNGYFEASVKTAFRKKYAQCLYQGMAGTNSVNDLCVPSDSWMLRDDVISACKRVYAHIMNQ